MALPNNPLINGEYPDWSLVNISMPGFRLLGVGCTELSYSFKNEPGEAEGTQQQVLGLTPGQYRAEGSITLHKRWAGQLREVLASEGGGFLSKLFKAARVPWSRRSTFTFCTTYPMACCL